jgi:hypothetical protein
MYNSFCNVILKHVEIYIWTHPNFESPHFAPDDIPKSIPPGKVLDHTAYIWKWFVFPFQKQLFFSFVHREHTL